MTYPWSRQARAHGVSALFGIEQAHIMAIFTLVKQYLVPVYKSEVVEAETLSAACTKAVESDNWRDAEIDYESARATYIAFAVRGAYHNAYDAPHHLAVPIPPAFSEATAELSLP